MSGIGRKVLNWEFISLNYDLQVERFYLPLTVMVIA